MSPPSLALLSQQTAVSQFAPFPDPAIFPGTRFSTAPISSLLAKELTVLTDQGLSPAAAMRAVRVNSAIGQMHLISQIAAATGSDYAGVWFEPSTARLLVGATSTKAHDQIEGALARTQSSHIVSISQVRSTMAELLAVQRRWNRKLAHLLALGEVTTGLEPQRNAVSITLSAAVSHAERARLTREAGKAAAKVDIGSSHSQRLIMTSLAKTTKCKKGAGNKFVKGEAYCDKPITAGVQIKSKNFCTAGPAAIPVNKKDRTVILTAGHCIDAEEGGTGINGVWSATNTAGVEGAIGQAVNYSLGPKGGAYCGGLCSGGDFGDIAVEKNNAWIGPNANDPVYAVTAEWEIMNKNKEEISYPVVGEQLPAVGTANCHVGQTSGESCGKVAKLNVTLAGKTEVGHKLVITEGQVEDTGATLLSEGGDSGGPFMAIGAKNEATMEGTLAGKVWECVKVANQKGPQFFSTEEECRKKENKEGKEGTWERTNKENVLYMPLKQPVGGAAAGSLEALNLELLTTKNELRVPRLQNPNGKPLTKTAYSNTLSGVTLETVSGSSVACSAGSGHGEISSTNVGTASLTLTECKGFTAKCRTSGASEGEIVLSAKYRLVFVNESEKVGYLLEFAETGVECGPNCPKMSTEKLKLRGSTIGLATPVDEEVAPSKVFSVAFSETKGVQAPTEYLNEGGEKATAAFELEGSGTTSFGFEQSALSTTDKLLLEEAAELEG